MTLIEGWERAQGRGQNNALAKGGGEELRVRITCAAKTRLCWGEQRGDRDPSWMGNIQTQGEAWLRSYNRKGLKRKWGAGGG